MASLPTCCPHCGGELDTALAGPRLAFCRPCRCWWRLTVLRSG